MMSEQYIKKLLSQMMKPRLICICGNFQWTGYVEFYYYKCSCDGYMSKKRLFEKGEYMRVLIRKDCEKRI